jgi:hypothetical protein
MFFRTRPSLAESRTMSMSEARALKVMVATNSPDGEMAWEKAK